VPGSLVSCNTQFFTIDAGWALIKNLLTRPPKAGLSSPLKGGTQQTM
jgi:hypothetical protein